MNMKLWKNIFGSYKMFISMNIVHIPISAPNTWMRYYKFQSVPLTLNEDVIKFTPTNNLVVIDK